MNLAAAREKVEALDPSAFHESAALWLRRSDVLAILGDGFKRITSINVEDGFRKTTYHHVPNERKGQQREKQRRAHDVYPGDEHRGGNCGIYGRRDGEDRRKS